MSDQQFYRLLVPGASLMSKRAMRAAKTLGLEVGLALPQLENPPSWSNDADFVVHAQLWDEGQTTRSFGLIGTALDSGCDALFPIWADAEQCLALSSLSAASRIAFIGGEPEQLSTVMNRIGVRWAASDLKMDVVTTSDKITDFDDAMYWIARLGYPLVMRTLRAPSERIFDREQANTILPNVLSKGPIVLERLLRQAREIETVMFALGEDIPICLGEVEISRRLGRHRAMIEFPPKGMLEHRLQKVRAQAAQLILGTKWTGIISARFLVTPDGRAYFLQLNPGLQPWHTAVESALSVNLYEAMLRVAMGEDLGWKQQHVQFSGHTLSMLIYATADGRIFDLSLPKIDGLHWGPLNGDVVKKGELLGSISVHGKTRQAAIVRAKVLLDELRFDGVPCNRSQLLELFNSKNFWAAPLSRDINQ